MYTAPKEESTLSCFLGSGREFILDPILDLDGLLESYVCSRDAESCQIVTKNMNWRCLAYSELSELHPGFLSFNAGLDYVVCRIRDVFFCKC